MSSGRPEPPSPAVPVYGTGNQVQLATWCVWVHGFNYTWGLEIRSRCTILLLPKSIAITHRVMPTQDACRWCYAPHSGEMITNFYVFYLLGSSRHFCILLYNIYKTHNNFTAETIAYRYSVYNHIVMTYAFGCYFGSSLQWYSFTLQTFLANYLIK